MRKKVWFRRAEIKKDPCCNPVLIQQPNDDDKKGSVIMALAREGFSG